MFHTLEQWVIDNAILTPSLRNRFARAMGYRDYFGIQGAQERADEPGAAVCHF